MKYVRRMLGGGTLQRQSTGKNQRRYLRRCSKQSARQTKRATEKGIYNVQREEEGKQEEELGDDVQTERSQVIGKLNTSRVQ